MSKNVCKESKFFPTKIVFRDVEKGASILVLIGQIFRWVYLLLQEEISPNHQNISLGLKPYPAQDHLGGKGSPDSKLGPIRLSRFGVHREHVKSDFAFII